MCVFYCEKDLSGLKILQQNSIDTIPERNNCQKHLKSLGSKHEKKMARKCVSSPLVLEGNTFLKGLKFKIFSVAQSWGTYH